MYSTVRHHDEYFKYVLKIIFTYLNYIFSAVKFSKANYLNTSRSFIFLLSAFCIRRTTEKLIWVCVLCSDWVYFNNDWSQVSLQIISHNFDTKNDFSGQTIGLLSVIDHRQPFLEDLERSVLLTFRWPGSTPKPCSLGWGQFFLVPWRVKKEQKSSSFLQLIEYKVLFSKELSFTFYVAQQAHGVP